MLTLFSPPSFPKSPQAVLRLLELLYDGVAEVCFVTKLCTLFWSRISKPVTACTLVALVTAFLQPLDDVLFFDGSEVYHLYTPFLHRGTLTVSTSMYLSKGIRRS